MDSHTNGLGKLLPKAIAEKRRRRKHQQAHAASADDASLSPSADDVNPLSRSLTSRETFESDGTNSTNMADDDETSFASHEPDHDATAASRPLPISTHPSQIGYLTTSSPIVQAEHAVSSSEPSTQTEAPPDLAAKASTFPSRRSESIGSDSSRQGRRSKTGLLPPRTSSRRSPSPVGRIRDVFKSRRAVNNSSSSSPERKSDGSQIDPLSDGGVALQSQNTPKPKADPPLPVAASDLSRTSSASPERRRPRAQTRIDTSATSPPRTPPTGETSAPTIVNTPPTPTDPSYTRDARHSLGSPVKTDASPNGGSPLGNMISQRRARAGSGSIIPSKLSNIIPAPLTPTPENDAATTPGLNAASGFFSSMISAAQNAANTISNSIQNTNMNIGQTAAGKPKGLSVDKEPDVQEEEMAQTQEAPVEQLADPPTESKEPAVKTLGTGELSLSQLGISEASSAAPTPIHHKFPDALDTRLRSESAPAETSPLTTQGDLTLEDSFQSNRPRSLYDQPGSTEHVTPAASVNEDKALPQRSGSVRSAIGRRRNRGSSAATGGTTGTTIGAAIAATHASVANPTSNASVPKLTGFAVASKKRNRDFHALFKSVPDDDYLIEDYSCALQREILAHGRLYVSEGHLCFSSNIFGWVTTLVMSFDEIVSVEKRSTALVFKNGLMIATLHAKHIFASFTSRDSTYDLIVNIWKLGHPSLKSTLNGVRLEGTGGDKTEKIEEIAEEQDLDDDDQSRSGSEVESDDDGGDIYDEDDENDGLLPEATQPTEISAVDLEAERAPARKPSGAVATNGTPLELTKDVGAPAPGADFPGPATHAPTDCGDGPTHYEKIMGDEIIPAPMGKVYNLVFGPGSVGWMSKWLTGDQKCTDLQMEDKKGLSLDNRTRTFSYIKPLYSSIGPKSTKCIVTETLDNFDLEKAINFSVSTQNPDVPSGNIFVVKTKYCLSWAENNATRVQINCTVEWSGKSWLKGPIEKGTWDGQGQYCKDLFRSLTASVSTRPRSGTDSNGAVVKGKKKGRKAKAPVSASETGDGERSPKQVPKQDWGMLEPVHSLLEPVVDIIRPLLTGNVMYGLLVGLLVASWFGFGFSPRPPSSSYGGGMDRFYNYPDRLAAYDEMWRREESELWEWLEERVGLDRLGGDGGELPVRKRAMEPRTVEEKLREEKMDEREIEAAIKTTEEKLNVLKGVIEKRKEKEKEGGRSALAREWGLEIPRSEAAKERDTGITAYE